jgi:hypothetical protein
MVFNLACFDIDQHINLFMLRNDAVRAAAQATLRGKEVDLLQWEVRLEECILPKQVEWQAHEVQHALSIRCLQLARPFQCGGSRGQGRITAVF